MTNEEKKAIEFLKGVCTDDCASRPYIVEPILNLIENQQKEIEELKEKNKSIVYNYEMVVDKLENSTPNAKIKAKIEELEKKQEDNRKSLYNAINNLCLEEVDKISDRIYVNMITKDILRSLLEEE